MRTCPECQQVMYREQLYDDDAGPVAIEYRCNCGKTVPGTAKDTMCAGKILGRGSALQRHQRAIRSGPFDRTVQLVALDCPLCKLDFLVQMRLGEEEIVLWRCDCGYDSSKPGAVRPEGL